MIKRYLLGKGSADQFSNEISSGFTEPCVGLEYCDWR